MLAYSYFPVVTIPTKINNNSFNNVTGFSLIDKIWSNFKLGCSHKSGVINFQLTDHLPIFYVFKTNVLNLIRKTKFRLFNSTSLENFKEKINDTSFLDVFETENPDEAFKFFYDKLFKIYNEAFPVKIKKIFVNNIKAPWVNRKLRLCIKKKFKLYNLMMRGIVSKRSYNAYKKTLVYVINKVKKLYFIKKFRKLNDPKKTWSNINLLLGRDKCKCYTELVDENNDRICEGLVPNHFNNYFTSVASKLVQDLPAGINWDYFRNINRVQELCVLLPTNC